MKIITGPQITGLIAEAHALRAELGRPAFDDDLLATVALLRGLEDMVDGLRSAVLAQEEA
jgi:hypothetical protein